MKTLRHALTLTLLSFAVALAGHAFAAGGHGGGGWHGGGHGGGWHGSVGFYFGGPYWGGYWPGYYYPYYPAYYPAYYPPYYGAGYAAGPTQYVEQGNGGQAAPAPESQGYWYYCADSRSYYPYVKECPSGWQRVAPQPPQQ